MAPKPETFMDAAEDLVAKLEASRLVAQGELEQVRKEIVRDLKREAKDTVQGLQTAKVGATKILVPNQANLQRINLSTERIRQRMSSFRLNYLDRGQVSQLKEDGALTKDPKKFIRHSRRLARHAREFLGKIGELEPDLQEEIDATLLEIEDNDMDLLKLEIRSMTRMKETMLRAVNGRKERGQVLKELDDWDMNRQLYNLSLLEHQDATVRQLFANSSERMASRSTTKVSEIPKRAHVLVALPPGPAAKLRPNSRTADLVWRVMDTASVKERFKKQPGTQAAQGSWRGLGLGFNTREWYVPVPPEIVEGLAPLAVAKRAEQLALAEEFARSQALTRPEE